MRVTVDPTRCVGAGQCVLTSPELFDQDDDGVVVLVDPDGTTDDRRSATLAADLCPSGAISLAEDTPGPG
ncbi:ferredoxin-1 [Amycolatopsis antarctica]|uniref:Ferredoxin n=1 Tax=Amycolatopsis antarctica TaxID=1854586 RepID=A0A263D822_9PSEU|nr:ferredoxin [Amycolatopsis antarctica]OZM74148.1 ferredoxin-1 [Amycolatopsis antarctica]